MYYWKPGYRISLRDCILGAVRLKEGDDEWQCALMHRRSAASFVLTEGCVASPALCTRERLRVVRMADLNEKTYNRLAHWASGQMKVEEIRLNFKTYNPNNRGSRRWIYVNGTRYPREISYEMHQLLQESYVAEYAGIEKWLEEFSP